MRNSPVVAVDPDDLPTAARARLTDAARRASEHGTIDLAVLPAEVREQLQFALDAIAHGQKVAAVAQGKALTTTEAAELLGMSRSHLTRLCKEGRIPSYPVGTSLRVDADTVLTILRERTRMQEQAREAASTADARRRARAAQAAGIS